MSNQQRWTINGFVRNGGAGEGATPTRQLIPWRERRISFSRLTNPQGAVYFFSERFVVAPRLVHEYVRGTIFTKTNLLKFYHQGQLIKVCRYFVNKTLNKV